MVVENMHAVCQFFTLCNDWQMKLRMTQPGALYWNFLFKKFGLQIYILKNFTVCCVDFKLQC